MYVYTKKRLWNGKIRLDGNLNAYIMYLADSENERIRGFSGNIDFTEILDFPGVEPGMNLDEEICIKEIECRVLNGRKVSIKAMLEINVKVSLNEKQEIIKEVNNIDDLQTQDVKLKINSLVRSEFL